MEFRITIHSGRSAPPGALERLAARLGAPREGARFAAGSGEIRATLAQDAPVSMAREEREDVERRALLEIVDELCEGSPGLDSDWFAISPRR